MALNSDMHEVYLNIPDSSVLMPVPLRLPFWARITHQIMADVNPKLMKSLSDKGELESYLRQQHERLKEEAMTLEKQWKKMNPLRKELMHNIAEAASWHNHCKLACREILIQELSHSLKEHR